MAFNSRRGRPASTRPKKDFGTPELIAKRRHQLTAEPIDLCLEHGVISRGQHWCALHLRWLYTLRYGAPGITVRDLTLTYGREIRPDDPQWRAEREREYHEAVHLLHRHKCYEAVMAVAIYNQLPSFLNAELKQRATHNTVLMRRLCIDKTQLVEGLGLLHALWCKPASSTPQTHGNFDTCATTYAPAQPIA